MGETVNNFKDNPYMYHTFGQKKKSLKNKSNECLTPKNKYEFKSDYAIKF
jgi:hypothetical protein